VGGCERAGLSAAFFIRNVSFSARNSTCRVTFGRLLPIVPLRPAVQRNLTGKFSSWPAMSKVDPFLPATKVSY
jgi:hypothetical protein